MLDCIFKNAYIYYDKLKEAVYENGYTIASVARKCDYNKYRVYKFFKEKKQDDLQSLCLAITIMLFAEIPIRSCLKLENEK